MDLGHFSPDAGLGTQHGQLVLCLSSHLREISEELLKLDGPIWQIVGYPDDLKICSCMTLFYLVSGDSLFQNLLNKFYNGQMDPVTQSILSSRN